MTQQEKKRWIAFGNQTNPFDRHNGIEIVDMDEGVAVVTVTLRQMHRPQAMTIRDSIRHDCT